MDLDLISQVLIDLFQMVFIYLIVTVSLNFMYGYTGIPHFGISLSVAGGGFVAGALSGRLLQMYYGILPNADFIGDNGTIIKLINDRIVNDPLVGIGTFILIIVLSLMFNAGLGYIVSRPAIRLSGSYLIIVFTAMAEAIYLIGKVYRPLVGGQFWVGVPNVFAFMGQDKNVGYLLVSGFITIIIFWIYQSMGNSPLGRLVRAVRENEMTAESIGKDVVGIRTKVVMLGSALASIAGVLWAFQIQKVISETYTRANWTFLPWLMFMVGGAGNNMGATIGTFAFITLRRLITQYKYLISPYVPFDVVWLEQMLMGSVLLLIIMFRPEGLIPEKPIKMPGINYSQLHNELKEKGVQVPSTQDTKQIGLKEKIRSFFFH